MGKLSLLEIYHHCIHSLPSRILRGRSWRRHSNVRERPLLMSMAAPAYREVSVKTPRRMDYYSRCKNPGMVKDTYQGMKVFIEQLSFDVPRGRQLAQFVLGLYDYKTWYMQWVGLSRETHIHCGANSGSSFGVRFELATCKFGLYTYPVRILRLVGCNWGCILPIRGIVGVD